MSSQKFSNSGFAYWVAIIISLLSIFSSIEKPSSDIQGFAYFWKWAQYEVFDNKLEIGIGAIIILLTAWLIHCLIVQPHNNNQRTSIILNALHKEIRIAPINEVQVSYFKIQKGVWLFGKYLSNIFWYAFSWQNLKTGVWWIYVSHKFPKFSKQYIVKTKQCRTMYSHNRPHLYFPMTNDQTELNGFVSFALATYKDKCIKTPYLKVFDKNKRKADYSAQEWKSIESYLKKMHLSYEDLRCLHTAANYIRVEIIPDREGKAIGVLVVDIQHAGKDLATEDASYKEVIARYAEHLFYFENFN